MGLKYDFSGWATRNDLLCSDGRTIRKNAFKDNDGTTVPLVWNHQHNDPQNVLGHALLENRDEGVYAYCTFNDTDAGRNSKLLVQHGDVSALSIYANQLKQNGGNVMHGSIREVSLVLAGANPGAFIDSVISHGENTDEEAIIYNGFEIDAEGGEFRHSDDAPKSDEKEDAKEEKMAEAKKSEKTVKDVFDELTEEQKNVVYFMIGQALEDAKGGSGKDDEDEGDEEMKHNVFDAETDNTEVLQHSEMMSIIGEAKMYGSMKESALAHGITDIEYLFPEDKSLNNPPDWISREMDWVKTVMNGVHHTPFSRVKSMFANITEDEARAKGYIKGKLKKEEVFTLLKRSTTPQTVYKKQKLDRDDVIDITDFDVVAWLKGEMRMMLDEELARAYLVGDGRSTSDDDKIDESHIRPIWKDEDLYTIKATANVAANATEDDIAKAVIRTAIKARKDYKGSGNPTLFTTEDMLTDMLLLTDNIGRDLYPDEAALAKKLRVKNIVTVPVMENLSRDVNGVSHTLAGIIVNLADYNVGADKGGSVNMFDDFDIDYNQMKYLIETRCSGAMIKPYAAIALEIAQQN